MNLATFRRNGREVRTPVWIARDGDRFYVYTNSGSGKVKRIRANGRVRLAPCDARGGLRGDWVEGTARMVDDPLRMERAFASLDRKYGWQMGLVRLGARLSGRWARRGIVEIRL